jgi:hypothetical protein
MISTCTFEGMTTPYVTKDIWIVYYNGIKSQSNKKKKTKKNFGNETHTNIIHSNWHREVCASWPRVLALAYDDSLSIRGFDDLVTIIYFV